MHPSLSEGWWDGCYHWELTAAFWWPFVVLGQRLIDKLPIKSAFGILFNCQWSLYVLTVMSSLTTPAAQSILSSWSPAQAEIEALGWGVTAINEPCLGEERKGIIRSREQQCLWEAAITRCGCPGRMLSAKGTAALAGAQTLKSCCVHCLSSWRTWQVKTWQMWQFQLYWVCV